MRRPGVPIFLLCLVLIWFVSIIYLAGLPPEPRGIPRINIGIVPLDGSRGPGSISLDDANHLIADIALNLPDESTEKEIYYIRGRGVEDTGNATSWLYGVVSQNRTFMVTYDQAGLSVTPWNLPFSGSAIDTKGIYSVHRLFREQSLLAQPAGAARQIELVNSTYYVTVSDGASARVYPFDAISGALMQPHEE